MLRIMLSRGGSYKDTDDTLKQKTFPDKEIVLALVSGWELQHENKQTLAEVPNAVLQAGKEAIKEFFAQLKISGICFRKKVCFVGPSESGKTSLIKTLTTKIPTLEKKADRTIGIDLFSWKFNVPSKVPPNVKANSSEEPSVTIPEKKPDKPSDAIPEKKPGKPSVPIPEKRRGKYEISIFDFAGQEVYQSAHSLFFSEKTLYVVCVNLELYANVYTEYNTTLPGKVDAFFDENIYSRIQAICAVEPESEFVFVGTKADRTSIDPCAKKLYQMSDDELPNANGAINHKLVEKLGAKLIDQFRRRERKEIKRLERAIEVTNKREISPTKQETPEVQAENVENAKDENKNGGNLAAAGPPREATKEAELISLKDMCMKRPKLVIEAMVAVSCGEDHKDQIDALMGKLEDAISNHKVVGMPSSWKSVADYLRNKAKLVEKLIDELSTDRMKRPVDKPTDKQSVADGPGDKERLEGEPTNEALTDRMKRLVVKPAELVKQIRKYVKATENFSDSHIQDILRVLHNLGDIMWFEKLIDVVFVSTKLACAFIRQIVNHKVSSHNGFAINEGILRNDLIEWLPLWNDVEDEVTMLQLKQLLEALQIAYPAYDNQMKADSDLIVPLLWKEAGVTTETSGSDFDANVCWEYRFQNGFPTSLFDRLIVTSHRQHIWDKAELCQDLFMAQQRDKYIARVIKLVASEGSSICIHVSAKDKRTAYFTLVGYVFCLEQLLEQFKGLWPVRYEITGVLQKRIEGLSSVRYEITGGLLRKVDELLSPPSASQDVDECPKMNWYEDKWWQQPKRPRYMDLWPKDQCTEDFDNYPEFWSLQKEDRGCCVYDVYTLKLLCRFSGKCFHHPIEIKILKKGLIQCAKALEPIVRMLDKVALGEALAGIVGSAGDKYMERCETSHGRIDDYLHPNERTSNLVMSEVLQIDRKTKAKILHDLLEFGVHEFKPCDVNQFKSSEVPEVVVNKIEPEPNEMREISCLQPCRTRKAVRALPSGVRDVQRGEVVWIHKNELNGRRDELIPLPQSTAAVELDIDCH